MVHICLERRFNLVGVLATATSFPEAGVHGVGTAALCAVAVSAKRATPSSQLLTTSALLLCTPSSKQHLTEV